jgi:ADP-ribosyl-[dinitrogen reductase] hydrolase
VSDIPPDAGDRARGTLLGQLAGDALGTTLEFETAAEIAARYPLGHREIVGGGPFRVEPGQVTDDGELALALARSLVDAGGYDPDRVAAAYVAWYESGPFDIGNTIRQAFGGAVEPGPGLAARLEARASRDSEANGSLMRISPLAIWGWALPAERLAELAARDSRLSHPHPHCQAACVVFTHAVARAIQGAGREALYEETLELARARPPLHWARDVLTAARAAPPADYWKKQGWVRVALQNAFYQLLHAPSVEDGLVTTVAQGGDTDTNGAIAGALLGAVHGRAAVPAQWREMILSCRPHALRARHPRPMAYWPSDALELAECLLIAGQDTPPRG